MAFYFKVKFPIRSRSDISYPTTNMEKMVWSQYSDRIINFSTEIDMAGCRNKFPIE